MDENEIPAFYKPDEIGYCCKCGNHTTMWSTLSHYLDDKEDTTVWECDTCYNKRFPDEQP